MKKLIVFFLGTWKKVFFIYIVSIVAFSFIYLDLFKTDQNNFNFTIKEESKKWDSSLGPMKDIEVMNEKINQMYASRDKLYLEKTKLLGKIQKKKSKALQKELKNIEKEIEENYTQEKQWMSALKEFHNEIKNYQKNILGVSDSLKSIVKENVVYIDILYFSVITATTTGYGDITPRSTETRFYVLIQILFSVFIFGLGLERFCSENFK